MIRFFKYHFTLIFSAAVIFISSSVPGDSLPEIGISFSDKLIHIIIYCVLSIAFIYSLKNQNFSVKLRTNAILFAFVFTSVYGATDEFHQYFVPNRTCELPDFFADVAGALLGCIIVILIYKFELNKKIKSVFIRRKFFEIKRDN